MKGCVIAIFVLLSAPAATASNRYPFEAPEDFLAPAEAFEAWAHVLDLHRAQLELIRQCATDTRACRGRLRSFNRMLAKAVALTDDEKIELVNFYINRSRYDDDRGRRLYDASGERIGYLSSSWMTLYDFLTQGGDCEDYATSKYFMLRELGFHAQDMKVVVVWERFERAYHALLAIRRPDAAVWLLDIDNRIKKTSHHGYDWVYAINEIGVWDHRDDFTRR